MEELEIKIFDEQFSGDQLGVIIGFRQSRDYSLHCLQYGSPGNKIIKQEVSEGAVLPRFANISRTNAQRLIDLLYHCGVRPTDAHKTVNHLNAVEKHLQDMRKIVSKKLNIDLEKENK